MRALLLAAFLAVGCAASPLPAGDGPAADMAQAPDLARPPVDLACGDVDEQYCSYLRFPCLADPRVPCLAPYGEAGCPSGFCRAIPPQ